MPTPLESGRTATVEFRAATGRDGPLTWSQRAWLGRIRNEVVEPAGMATYRWEIVAGVGPAQALDAVRQLVERFEALRTSIDSAEPERARQTVAAAGTMEVRLHEAANADSIRDTAWQVGESLRDEVGASATPWPAAFALIVHDSMVRAVVFAASYFAVDATSAEILSGALRAVLDRGTLPDLPGYDWHPLDQAGEEQGAAGQRQHRRSMAHWRRCFELGPASLFPRPVESAERPFVEFDMDSPALTAALPRAAGLHGLGEAVIALTATCLVLRKTCGTDRLLLELIFNNRWREETRNAICNITQNSAFFADLRGADFATAAAVVAEESFRAHRSSHHDPVAVHAMLEEIGGVGVERSGYFSYQVATGAAQPIDTAPPDWEALIARTTITQLGRHPAGGTKFFLSVEEGVDRRRYRLFVNTDHLPVPFAERLLRNIEATVVAHATTRT